MKVWRLVNASNSTLSSRNKGLYTFYKFFFLFFLFFVLPFSMVQTAIENPYAISTPKKLSKEKKVKEMVGKNISPLFTTRRDEMILLNTGSWVKVSLCAHTDMRLLWVNKGRTELSDWKTASWTRQRDDSSFALTALFYWSYEKKIHFTVGLEIW